MRMLFNCLLRTWLDWIRAESVFVMAVPPLFWPDMLSLVIWAMNWKKSVEGEWVFNIELAE